MRRPKNQHQAERKEGARRRQEERALRTVEEQLQFLDDRPGQSLRERARLGGIR